MTNQCMVKAHFFVQNEKIQKIEIVSSDKLLWQLSGGSQNLERQISNWWEIFWSKKKDPPLLPLNFANLSPFSKSVLEKLQKVPFGTTLCYQELAALAGSPKAARAVGTACKKNPFPLVIPCHRVLGKRDLGGYFPGIALKRHLLAFESGTRPA